MANLWEKIGKNGLLDRKKWLIIVYFGQKVKQNGGPTIQCTSYCIMDPITNITLDISKDMLGGFLMKFIEGDLSLVTTRDRHLRDLTK